jgi:altronate hydrolase
MRLIRIHPSDDVLVAVEAFPRGGAALGVRAVEDIPAGHKMALRDIASGENVLKYGMPIGRATAFIPKGGWVHVHNLRTNLDSVLTYARTRPRSRKSRPSPALLGYARADGGVGIRNEVWILPTVGCVNGVAEALARSAAGAFGVRCTPSPTPTAAAS